MCKVNPDIYLKLICCLFLWQDKKETLWYCHQEKKSSIWRTWTQI